MQQVGRTAGLLPLLVSSTMDLEAEVGLDEHNSGLSWPWKGELVQNSASRLADGPDKTQRLQKSSSCASSQRLESIINVR